MDGACAPPPASSYFIRLPCDLCVRILRTSDRCGSLLFGVQALNESELCNVYTFVLRRPRL